MHLRHLLLVSSLGFKAYAAARNIVNLKASHETSQSEFVPDYGVTIQLLKGRGDGVRCGPGVGTCFDGKCCSIAGYCGITADHCRSPDCQIDFGHCDAHEMPVGPPTEDVPRTHVGTVPYGPHVIRACAKAGTIALTYDDGPKQYTAELLDLLDRYGAKATFFVTGINNGKGPIDSPDEPWAGLIQRMYQTGHQVASHTWSHQDLSKITPEQRREQIFNNEAAFRNILGKIPTYMRPPYSSCLPETGCLDDMGNWGYHIILYDIDTKDYSHDSPNEIQVSKDVFDSSLAPWKASEKSWLVIAHDVHEQTVHNLTEHMLRRIADYGYRAVTVGECLEDPEENWYREAGEPISGVPVKKSPPQPSTPQPPPSDAPKIASPDGTCGEKFTCAGSSFGPCCSSANYCGTSNLHCGFGCQPNAGNCFEFNEPPGNNPDGDKSRPPETGPGSGDHGNDHEDKDDEDDSKVPGTIPVKKPVFSAASSVSRTLSSAASLMMLVFTITVLES